VNVAIEAILAVLRSNRFNFNNEADLQAGISSALSTAGIPHLREHRLSGEDRIDFYFTDRRIGMEVKIKGSPSAVLSQLLRYAQHDDVASLILVTSRLRLAGEEESLNGKPVSYHQIWTQNL
jgi:hypothetical protein